MARQDGFGSVKIMKKALLVIDMQEATVGKDHADFFKYDSALLDRVNKVISETDAAEVVYIRNLMKDNLINRLAPVKVFDKTKEAQLAEGLKKISSNVFSKYKGDAFTDPQFCGFLKNNSIDTVELIGVDGGGCVSLTALGACKNGYKVIMNTKAIDTMSAFVSKKEKYYAQLKKLGAQFI